MKRIRFKPIWFDSLCKKSSCTIIKTPDVSVQIDRSVAAYAAEKK